MAEEKCVQIGNNPADLNEPDGQDKYTVCHGMGTDEFLKIIRYVIKDANVFVISHKPDLQEKFENVIRFEKLKGFSRMTS